MHADLDVVDILCTVAILFAMIAVWFGQPALRSFLGWYEDRKFRIATSKADEMWRAGQQGELLPPPPRRPLRLVGKERGQ